MAKLFISYRSLDSAKVDAIVARLRSLKNADGTPVYDIWQDKTNIPVGQDWWKAIIQGIIGCDVFVYMISSESVQNINCRAELSYARKRNRPIIPLVLEGEFDFNPVTGKNDVAYWNNVPDELNDGRFQLLFYDDGSFVGHLNQSVDTLLAQPPRDIPAPEPPDPRHASDASNDTSLIYDQACDYAWRMDFGAAEKLFQRLMDWRDPLFADDAHEWILLLRAYEQIARLHERESSRYKVPVLWVTYSQQFPKPFTSLFDPKEFKNIYEHNSTATPQPVALPQASVATPVPVTLTRHRLPRSRVYDILPAPFDWIEIPAGKVTLVNNRDDRIRYYLRKNQPREFEVPTFQLAKYPITNAQYAVFVRDGYPNRKCWEFSIEAENWHYINPEPPETGFSGDDMPRTNVNWYEAVAFCRWLGEVSGEQIMLPTEQQWQRAAQGDGGGFLWKNNRTYPWGNKWDASRCNNNKTGHSQPTPVMQYEGKGNSPFGVVDLAGNVWEWCCTDYYNGDDDISIESSYRVQRGGSWNDSKINQFRCDYRSFDYPSSWHDELGFRVSCVNINDY